MKKLLLSAVIVMGIGFAASAQTAPMQEKKASKEKAALKDHVCTDACKKAGKCVVVHGEKGHKCTKECKKKMA